MPSPDKKLLQAAEQCVPADERVRDCWTFVVKGIELGWLESAEIRDLIAHLQSHRDFGVEELLFAHIGDDVRVSFLDDTAVCSPVEMASELATLLR